MKTPRKKSKFRKKPCHVCKKMQNGRVRDGGTANWLCVKHWKKGLNLAEQ